MNRQMRCRIAIAGVLVVLALTTVAMAQDPAPAPAQDPAAAPAAAPAPAPNMDDRKSIVCDGKAKSDGKVEFLFTPQGGAAKTISVTIAKGMKQHDACRDIAKELGVALGEAYRVDQYDPDKVKVEGKDKAQFSLTIGAMSVEGFSVSLK